jgi:hypothetical protein
LKFMIRAAAIQVCLFLRRRAESSRVDVAGMERR